MDYSLESNERTLVMFDSVCAGLASCLALVHADIRHMSDQRNRLAELEQEQIRAKCRSAQELFAAGIEPLPAGELFPESDQPPGSRLRRHNKQQAADLVKAAAADDSGLQESSSLDLNDNQQLAGLKFLDKRLAESFTQAFNANEQQKSSIAAKEQAYNARPTILQLLLGKTLSRKSSTSSSSASSTSTSASITASKASHRRQPALPATTNKVVAPADVVDNKLLIDDINRQIRLAMQYIKQLESHLFKLEDLRPKYEMHLKMGLLVRNNNNNNNNQYSSTNSLKSSKSKTVSESNLNLTNKTTSFSNINNNNNNNRTTIRDFIENVAKIEQEFEAHMGSFLLAIEDIQGFARVCQGDVFEISIKYGDTQKFKTRISVLKDNKQKCDHRQSVFKAKIADVLAIKAYECKGLGKRLLLGHKLCETRDLFTAQSQLMTISLNQTGSIKLNMVVTWNPLHMAPTTTLSTPGLDISHISLPPTPISTSTLSSLSSMPSINGTTTTINIKSQSRARLNDSFNSNSDNSCHHLNHHHQQQQQHQHQYSPAKQSRHSYHKHQQQQQQRKQADLYQTIDPTYGYYIPAPDYLSNEAKYSDHQQH